MCVGERERAIHTHCHSAYLRLKSNSAEMKEEAVWIWDFVSSGTGINTQRLECVRSRHSTRAIVLSKWGVSDVH